MERKRVQTTWSTLQYLSFSAACIDGLTHAELKFPEKLVHSGMRPKEMLTRLPEQGCSADPCWDVQREEGERGKGVREGGMIGKKMIGKAWEPEEKQMTGKERYMY